MLRRQKKRKTFKKPVAAELLITHLGSIVQRCPAILRRVQAANSWGRNDPNFLGVTSPFFPGILLSRKPPKTLGKWLVFEKNDG